MSRPALARLTHTLGAGIPELSTLSDTELERLNLLIEQARHRQRQALAEAIERGLSYVPALLRGPITRIIRG